MRKQNIRKMEDEEMKKDSVTYEFLIFIQMQKEKKRKDIEFVIKDKEIVDYIS